MKRTMLVAIALLGGAFDARAADLDGDGIRDPHDNCLTRANPRQLDPDLDGYGNHCDGDLDQDGDVDQDDQGIVLGGSCGPECDFNEDGDVLDFYDFGVFGTLFGLPPGPSGLACAGTVPCVPEVPALSFAIRGALALTLIATASALRRRSRLRRDAVGGRIRAGRESPPHS